MSHFLNILKLTKPCFRYDLVAGQWISVASMSMRRSSVGVCIVDIPSKILDSVKVRRSEI